MKPTRLETEILDWFSSRNSNEAFRQQCANATVISRTHTGAVLFVYLNCPTNYPKVNFNCTPNAPLIQSPLLKHGAGVDLWLEDGHINHIEIVTFGGDAFPETSFAYTLVDQL